MWDKLVLAARAIASIENPADVCVISARQIAQRAVLKYARYTGKKCLFNYSLILKHSLEIKKNMMIVLLYQCPGH